MDTKIKQPMEGLSVKEFQREVRKFYEKSSKPGVEERVAQDSERIVAEEIKDASSNE